MARLGRDLGAERPFKREERVRIRETLDEVHRFLVATRDLQEEQVQFVRDRLDYLKEATERQPRGAWSLMLMGVILSFILNAIVPPSAVQEFLRFVADQLAARGGLLLGK